MAFPKWLFVTEHKDSDGSKWLNAHRDQIDAVEEDDKTGDTVATYQLVKAHRGLSVVKTLKFAEKKRRKK